MNPQDIAHHLTELEASLVDKLGRQPTYGLHLNVGQTGRCFIHVYANTGEQKYDPIPASGDTFAEVLDAAARIIADLPSAEDRNLHEFMGALGRVINLGRKNGVDVSYINPLQGTMERLSSNALTCRAAVA